MFLVKNSDFWIKVPIWSEGNGRGGENKFSNANRIIGLLNERE